MKRFLPLAFAFIKFISGYFLINPVYELQRDEYLYLNQGQHLAWGYLEVPPLIAAQGWASLQLGGGEGWVKFWPFLWGAATIYLVVRLAGRLGGGWFAQTLAGVCYLCSAFARLNLLFQPNSFEVFGFMACLYGLVRYLQQERPRYLYLLGVGLGLGLLNKYTTLFFIAALGGALLLTSARRLLLNRLLGRRGRGLAGVAAQSAVANQPRHSVSAPHGAAQGKPAGARGSGRFLEGAAAHVLSGPAGVGAGAAGAAADAGVSAVPSRGAGGGAGRGVAGRAARQGLLRPGLLPGDVCVWGSVVGRATGRLSLEETGATGFGGRAAGASPCLSALGVPIARPGRHGGPAPQIRAPGRLPLGRRPAARPAPGLRRHAGLARNGRQNLGRLPNPARFGAGAHPHSLRQLRPGQRHQLLQPPPRAARGQQPQRQLSVLVLAAEPVPRPHHRRRRARRRTGAAFCLVSPLWHRHRHLCAGAGHAHHHRH